MSCFSTIFIADFFKGTEGEEEDYGNHRHWTNVAFVNRVIDSIAEKDEKTLNIVFVDEINFELVINIVNLMKN